jgi:hypothetical protein
VPLARQKDNDHNEAAKALGEKPRDNASDPESRSSLVLAHRAPFLFVEFDMNSVGVGHTPMRESGIMKSRKKYSEEYSGGRIRN